MTIAVLLFILFVILSCLGMGMIFKKMNLGFVNGIIPFHNKLILIKKYTLPPFHFLLVFIPGIWIYTNYAIYKKICEQYNKDNFYAVELAIFPFVYNFFLGTELPQEEKKEEIEQEEPEEEPKKVEEDIYTWHPKEMLKSNTVYKAARNNFGGKVNVKINENNEIIDEKKKVKKQKENKKECPNCSAKINESAKTCPVCGTTL